ncbi:hypothetical protein ON010_g16799 [Phytophthora cinnamomi]|nr:hypothetical protein ON010_g16799 [Phytophthora cinnamomi]
MKWTHVQAGQRDVEAVRARARARADAARVPRARVAAVRGLRLGRAREHDGVGGRRAVHAGAHVVRAAVAVAAGAAHCGRAGNGIMADQEAWSVAPIADSPRRDIRLDMRGWMRDAEPAQRTRKRVLYPIASNFNSSHFKWPTSWWSAECVGPEHADHVATAGGHCDEGR